MSHPVMVQLIAPGWEAPRLIEQGQVVHLGSGPQAEVSIEGEGVEALHYRIEWEGDVPLLARCADPLDRRPLADGDEIVFGDGARVRVRLRGEYSPVAGSPHLCRECHQTLSQEESADGGRYRIGELVLCRRCVWAGSGEFPLVSGLRLVHLLGGGMAGKVYEAHDWKSGSRVAVKLMPIQLPGHTQQKARNRFGRLQREMGLLARLRHPHILRTHGIGQESGNLFIIMEFVSGNDWQHLLMRRGRPYDADEVRPQLEELGSAMDYAHREGIVHRDIKPGNILVNDRGFLKVTDFGLARKLTDPTRLTRTGTLLGTVPFASPEQLRDPRGVGPRSDVYSVAATVYCLLTGQPPFVHQNHYRLLRMIRDELPPELAERRPDLPGHLGTTLSRAMAKDPALRPRSVGELIDALYPA